VLEWLVGVTTVRSVVRAVDRFSLWGPLRLDRVGAFVRSVHLSGYLAGVYCRVLGRALVRVRSGFRALDRSSLGDHLCLDHERCLVEISPFVRVCCGSSPSSAGGKGVERYR